MLISRFRSFLATIRCGHTYANFYNQSKAVQTALFSGQNKLPFQFRWLGERMVVLRNQSSNPVIKPGTEILSVDGRPASEILTALMEYARADGHNDAKRRAILEVRGYDRFEYFDVFFGLLFPPKDGMFRLHLRPFGTTAEQVTEVPAIDLAARRQAMVAKNGDPNAALWTLSFTPQSIALLTMPTWETYDSKWDWRGFLDAAFRKMQDRKAKGLIVDLRGNEGGEDCGNEIIARLIDRDLPLESYERRVRFHTTPVDLNPYLDTWDKSFKTLGVGATDLGNGFYRLEPDGKGDDNTLIKAKGPRFRGKTAVLIDSQNSSATVQFASTMRANGLGTLIGEPTGGNQRGINGGAFFFLRLPASGLEADLPLVGTFPKSPKPDAGLLPDRTVMPTMSDIAKGYDAAMAAAVALVTRS